MLGNGCHVFSSCNNLILQFVVIFSALTKYTAYQNTRMRLYINSFNVSDHIKIYKNVTA